MQDVFAEFLLTIIENETVVSHLSRTDHQTPGPDVHHQGFQNKLPTLTRLDSLSFARRPNSIPTHKGPTRTTRTPTRKYNL